MYSQTENRNNMSEFFTSEPRTISLHGPATGNQQNSTLLFFEVAEQEIIKKRDKVLHCLKFHHLFSYTKLNLNQTNYRSLLVLTAHHNRGT